MGRSKVKQKKKSKVKKPLISSYTVPELLNLMQEKIDTFQYDEASNYSQEALKKEPDNIDVLEASGSLCIEVGNLEGAKHLYGRAITILPEQGYSKYFAMGQLMCERESLRCYLKGIEILSKKINSDTNINEEKLTAEEKSVENPVNTNNNEDTDSAQNNSEDNVFPFKPISLQRELSMAYCSVAELFMTDLCDDEEAEKESHKNIEKAIEVDPTNPEAFQHMANFLLIKEKNDEAKEYISKSLSLWLPKYEAIVKEQAEAGSFDPVEVCELPYSTRVSASKILIEVGDNESADNVLGTLLAEDEEDVLVWYLLGWNAYLRSDEFKPEAKDYFLTALKVNKKCPISDEELLNHIKELLEELKDVKDKDEGDLELLEGLDICQSSDEEEEEVMETT